MSIKRRVVKKVPQTKTIQVGFYEVDGKPTRVITGAFLGSVELVGKSDNAYFGEGEFRGKKFPISVVINSVGTIPPYLWHQYDEQVLDPVQPVDNFLPWLEDYRKEKLTPSQISFLSACTLADTRDVSGNLVEGLHTIQKKFFYENLGNWAANWNPFIDAINSIMQNDNGMTENFPKRRYISVPHYEEQDGHKVVGADIRLFVNGAQFTAGEGGVSRCNGAIYKYFTWDAAVGVFPDGEVYYPPQVPGTDD